MPTFSLALVFAPSTFVGSVYPAQLVDTSAATVNSAITLLTSNLR